jgi:aminopeptidase N
MKISTLQDLSCGCLALLGLVLSDAVGAGPGFSLVDTPGQLPRDVMPKHYAIALAPDPNSLTFAGSETIDVEVRKATSEIVLNALELSVSGARLEDMNLDGRITLDAERQTVSLAFPQTVGAGTHRLRLDFKGKVNEAAEGLFYTRFQTPGGRQKLMFCTQLEPTDARRVFPVWDEPAYRSTFELAVEVPEAFTAISNMPAKREEHAAPGVKRVRFERTPAMASYLVVLCAGEFETLADEVDGIRIRVVTTEGKSAHGGYAIAALKQLIPYYNEYFGLKYPLPKLDLIAVPGGIPGAMENWGGITFNEAALLFDPARSPQYTRERIFSILAHEVAHQWFGNLVTMAWWDDLWLNEGFATWMQNRATDHFNPTWQVWAREDRAKQAAMDLDARSTTHPIQQAIKDPAEAAGAFDMISYTKAASIIRMIEAHVGETSFRAGIRRYMADHQYSNTTTSDLWDALEQASGEPIGTITSRWTRQPGFPLIHARTDCQTERCTLQLSQERFTVHDAGAAPLQWPVPLTFASVSDDRSRTSYLLSSQVAQLDLGSATRPVKVNFGNEGYYRVQYAPADQKALIDQFARLAPEDRLNLLADGWALVCGDRASAVDYLSLLEALKAETDTAVWDQVIATLGELDRLEQGRAGRAAFRAYARTVLQPLYDRLGWDAVAGEAEIVAPLRSAVLTALGRFGDEAVIAEARRRFADFLGEESLLPPNLRPAVFSIVGRYADRRTYDRLHDLARRAGGTEQKNLFYEAMSAAQSSDFAAQTLALSLSEEVEPQVASRLLLWVARTGEQADMAWAFLKANSKAVLAKVSFFGRYRYVGYMADSFNDQAQATDLVQFARTHLPADAMPEIEKAAERIEFRDGLKRRELPKLEAWVCGRIVDEDKRRIPSCGG